MANENTQIGNLIYDAASELLWGVIGAEKIHPIKAVSGGSRGHVPVSARVGAKYLHSQAGTLLSHLATTREIDDGHRHYLQRGGTLPPGHYRCIYRQNHSHFHECIQLDMRNDAKAIRSIYSPRPFSHGRKNDFFIHGSGKKGSDGCIVISNHVKRHKLNLAVRDFQGEVSLVVKNVSYALPAELDHQIA